jgi:drug/metabolite transporter (DMT)-like permease
VTDTKTFAAALFTVLAWASAFVVTRAVAPHIHPGPLSLGRLAVGLLILGLFLLRAGWVRPARRDWLLVGACGAVWFGLYNLALAAAARRLDAGTTAMLVNVGPLLIALLAARFLGERLSRWLLIGSVVSMAGVALIARASSSQGASDRVGVLLGLAAAATYAIGVVLQKVVLRRLPALQVTWMACAAGAIVCVPFAGQLRVDLSTAPPSVALGVLYLGVVPTALAFTTWAYALIRTDAGRLAAVTYAAPPGAVVMSWLFLGEAPLPIQLAGGGLCLIGVAISRRRRETPAHEADAAPPIRATLSAHRADFE